MFQTLYHPVKVSALCLFHVCMFPHCIQDLQVHEYYHSLNIFTIDSCIEQTSVDLGRIDATTRLGEYSNLPHAVGQK